MAEFLVTLGSLATAGVSTLSVVEKVFKCIPNPPDELLALANEISATNQAMDRARIIITQEPTQSTGPPALEADPINFGQILGRASGIYVQIKAIFDGLDLELGNGSWKHVPRMVWIRRKEQLLKLQSKLVECRKGVIDFIGMRNQSPLVVESMELQALWKAGHSMTRQSSQPAFKNKPSLPSYMSLSTKHARNGPACDFPCGCACHKQSKSSYETGFLGTLFVGSRWSLFAVPACTERKCRGRSISLLRFTYYFPSWYVQKAVSFLYRADGPQFSLKFSNIIPEAHDLFGCVKTGDVKKLKLLLESRQASPTDIDHDGDGLLICTLELKEFSLEMCNFVYSLPGVDPLATNRYGQSFVSLAWQLILSMDPETRHSDPLASWLVSVISKYDYFEDRQFKPLHKVVTDCSSVPLVSQLETSTSDIDDPDASGWTPLMWATFRHNAKAIQSLLDFGADANLLNNEGQHALHLGCWSWNPKKPDISSEVKAFKRLVNMIPQVNLLDKYNWRPLMYAAGTARSVDLLKALVDAGADVNLSGHANITPLHWAAQVNRSDAVRCLISVGAELQAVNNENKTALHLAVSENAHESLLVLVEFGAAHPAVLGDGGIRTLFFEAARFGDAKTFDILADAELPPFNMATTGQDGLTVQQVFENANSKPLDDDLMTSWENFLSSTCDEWHDVMETLDS